MMIDRRLVAGALGLTLVLAACGGTSTATGEPAATAAATAATTDAAASEPAAAPETEEAQATEEPAPTDDGGSTGAVNDLAATLPETAGGVTFERAGYDGSQLGVFGAAAGLSDSELDPILKASGKTLNDVNFAVATSSSTGATAMIYAIQIKGLPATEFADSMSGGMSSMPQTTLGGKTVYGEASGGFGAYVYAKDDTMYLILLADEKLAGAILEQLP
jgi:hypothetical protein